VQFLLPNSPVFTGFLLVFIPYAMPTTRASKSAASRTQPKTRRTRSSRSQPTRRRKGAVAKSHVESSAPAVGSEEHTTGLSLLPDSYHDCFY
jgi:hypothetical protein